jgi:hypothetical protein
VEADKQHRALELLPRVAVEAVKQHRALELVSRSGSATGVAMEAVKQHSALGFASSQRQRDGGRSGGRQCAGVCSQGAAAQHESHWRPSSSTVRLGLGGAGRSSTPPRSSRATEELLGDRVVAREAVKRQWCAQVRLQVARATRLSQWRLSSRHWGSRTPLGGSDCLFPPVPRARPRRSRSGSWASSAVMSAWSSARDPRRAALHAALPARARAHGAGVGGGSRSGSRATSDCGPPRRAALHAALPARARAQGAEAIP